MNTATLKAPAVDLSKLSLEELQKALEAKKNEKNVQREAYKELVAETVPKAFFRLATMSDQLSQTKMEIFKYFEDVLSLKNEVYGIKEKQQSHTFTHGNAQITIGFNINDGWDDTVTAGVEKVKNFISGLSNNEETAALVQMVMSLLAKDAKGNLKANRVLELQKLVDQFNNAEFADGVDIIAKAYKPVRSSWFIESYLIKENGDKQGMPLSMSSADFPAGYEFNFFNTPSESDAGQS